MTAPAFTMPERERVRPLSELPASFRAEAARLEPYAPHVATAFRACAIALEQALAAQASDLLTLPEAAAESGYSAEHLGRLVKQGALANHGRKHAPRVRRGDLPKKPKAAKASARGVVVAECVIPADFDDTPADPYDFTRARAARRTGGGQGA